MRSVAVLLRRLSAVFSLSLLGIALTAAMLLASAPPAQAQLFGPSNDDSGDFFNPFRLFSPGPRREQRQYQRRERSRSQAMRAPVDYSKAPPPPKLETQPTQHVVVMGASLAGWLAYGLELAFAADRPDIGVIRDIHSHSGLIRFDAHNKQDWAEAARDFLKDNNVDVVVMLIGLEDRDPIRPRPQTAENAQNQGKTGEPHLKLVTPEHVAKKPPAGPYPFRSDQWAAVYSRRIDQTIAALKSKGVPVIWVGLPAIRGTRSTSDMIYLNDLFRARAEHAGINYVDVWDGFVDDSGRFVSYGPDLEGQVRRLRTPDGVYFTKAGARKLAHYVEREVKRVIGTRLPPTAMPLLDENGNPVTAAPGQQPVAGPVYSLTQVPSVDTLVGGITRPHARNRLATDVLVKGDPAPVRAGRADDFFLTPEAAAAAKAAAKPKPTSTKPTPAKPQTAAPATGSEAALTAPTASPDSKPVSAKTAPAATAVVPTAPTTTNGKPETEKQTETKAKPSKPKPAVAEREPTAKPENHSTEAHTPPATHQSEPHHGIAERQPTRRSRERRAVRRRPRQHPIFDPLGLFSH